MLVNVGHAYVQTSRCLLGKLEVVGPHRAAQPEVALVGQRHGFINIGGPVDDRDRSEEFL